MANVEEMVRKFHGLEARVTSANARRAKLMQQRDEALKRMEDAGFTSVEEFDREIDRLKDDVAQKLDASEEDLVKLEQALEVY